MNNRQTRALVLIAGNGATIAFLAGAALDNASLVRPIFVEGNVKALPLFAVVAVIGLGAGYVGLLSVDNAPLFASAESLSAMCFALIVTIWAFYLVGFLGPNALPPA